MYYAKVVRRYKIVIISTDLQNKIYNSESCKIEPTKQNPKNLEVAFLFHLSFIS